MDFVSDTNIWYDIGDGSLDATKIKQGGTNRLLAPALVALEISSKITEENFSKRRAAAQAALDHADEILIDPERVFAGIWGIQVKPLAFDWLVVLKAIAKSKNVSDLNTGGQGIMKINTQAAQDFRAKITNDFVRNVENSIRSVIGSQYATRKLNGQMDHLEDPELIELLRNGLASPISQEGQILLTRKRVAEHAIGKVALNPTQEELEAATPQLLSFVQAYIKYMEKVATKFGSRPNDWVDLHCFAYLQGNRQLLTGDKRWLTIAEDIGIGHQIADLKTF